MQQRMLHIGLYGLLLVSCLPTCVDETRATSVKSPSHASKIPVAVTPAAREIALPPDAECLERGVGNALESVSVLVPEYDIAARSFVASNAKLQIVPARSWEPTLTLRIGWVIGRIIMSHPNGRLQSLLGTMGRLTKEDIALPAWTAKHDGWFSDPIAVMIHRTGIAAELLPSTGVLDEPITYSALWTLDQFRSFQLLDQEWMTKGMEVADLILADYTGIVSFSAHAVEFRDADGSLGCASVFNRR